ncbi:MAG TPA: FGGY-family carbohydrate kinase [Kineosporiaceae bacterium]|nr:FGGY-family carbohydrate kinase [Kineosporiaceae bacterium]
MSVVPERPAVAPDAASSYALVVDLGSTAVKVGLATLTGRVHWHAQQDLETVLFPDGGAEQDAQHWWEVVLGLSEQALASGACDPRAVVAVAVTGQWCSTVPVDGAGEPVGPCLMWLDSRGGAEAVRRVGGPVSGYAPAKLLTWVRHSGGAPSLDGCDPLGHRWWLQTQRPDLHDKARWLLEPVDYLTMRFSGLAHATAASMTASWLTDNRTPNATAYDPTLLRLAGVDAGKLAPLLPNASVQGRLLPELSRRLGLSPQTVVISGIPDAQAVAVGSGAVLDFETHLSLGTTSWVSCHVPFKKTDVINQIAAVPSCLPGSYLVLNNHETSGRCLHWLRDVLDPSGRGEHVPFEALTELAAGSRPGSGGVIFTPWLAGERTPIADRNARGGFHNVSLSTTRADLVRAVLEGVALNDLWTHEVMEKYAGRRLDQIRAVGGGALSDLWCQIHADALDRTVERAAEPNVAGLRGVALVAGVALGSVATERIRELVPVSATFRPDPAATAAYRRLFAEFPGLYRAQKKMFARLNAHG